MWGSGFGWGRGRGWGRGFGRGFGYGRGYGWGGNPYVCARFPWLPRWWWANPSTYGSPYSTYQPYAQAPQQTTQPVQQPITAPYYPSTPYTQAPQQTTQPVQQSTITPYYPVSPFVPPPTPEQEIETLEGYKTEIGEELKGIEARIKELKGT